MTQTKQVITKRMAQKKEMSIRGTSGRVVKPVGSELQGSKTGIYLVPEEPIPEAKTTKAEEIVEWSKKVKKAVTKKRTKK